MEQERRLGSAEPPLHHQPGLAPQPPQPGLTGATGGRKPPQGTIIKGRQGRPTVDAGGPQAALLQPEVGR